MDAMAVATPITSAAQKTGTVLDVWFLWSARGYSEVENIFCPRHDVVGAERQPTRDCRGLGR